MTQDPNYRPPTSAGDPPRTPEADRPAPGPHAAGDPQGTFPRDEGAADRPGGSGLAGREPQGPAEEPARGPGASGGAGSTFAGQETSTGYSGRSAEPGVTPAGGGAPQAVDPGLADQETGGPAGRPAWGQSATGATGATGATAATMPAREGTERGPESAEEPSLNRFRERWPAVQGAFVDDPRNAVAEADRLLAEVIQEVEQTLTRRRRQLQAQHSSGEREPDTEQLRQTMHGYRALFHRLLERGV